MYRCFKPTEIANLEVDPNERFFVARLVELRPRGHAGEGRFARRNRLITGAAARAFVIVISLPSCTPAGSEPSPLGQLDGLKAMVAWRGFIYAA